ncbi:hypothetical protein ABT390_04245 [Streptomyces aurantiacus]|uniref:Uncharacterized protein n=1 Tax=Streptomyces aurantiacus JA 4570 TaxID=1286094 RepID=S4A2U9_9ACTN|nr:hypothetical protein [Streptomyces aurantiacus]EPH45030.1 hypothetical protein STRAU_1931 [Streptomyces aurantiacus JA 4570]
MSTRAVLVAALITGLVLGIVGTRSDDSIPSRRDGPIAEAGD